MKEEINQSWEKEEISEEARKTAQHIGIISEGAIQTLIDETRQELKEEILKKLPKKFKPIDRKRNTYYEDKITGYNHAIAEIKQIIEKI